MNDSQISKAVRFLILRMYNDIFFYIINVGNMYFLFLISSNFFILLYRTYTMCNDTFRMNVLL